MALSRWRDRLQSYILTEKKKSATVVISAGAGNQATDPGVTAPMQNNVCLQDCG